MDAALHGAGDDLCVRVGNAGMLKQGRNQQGLVLHQAEHGQLPIVIGVAVLRCAGCVAQRKNAGAWATVAG
ncbi:hypothetical protein D3C85_1325480 [compost metagenome]